VAVHFNDRRHCPSPAALSQQLRQTGGQTPQIDLLIEDNRTLYPLKIKKHADPDKGDI
jgi:hypothetical protein